MHTNTSCTLFLKSNNYQKVFIEKCFYTETRVANYRKTGLTTGEKGFCLFPFNDLILDFTEGKDYFFEGDIDFGFDSSTPQKESASLGALLKMKGVKTIMQADLKKYGSANMWHYELSCK